MIYLDAENGPTLMAGRFDAMGWTDFTNLKYNPSPEITLDQIGKFLHDVDSFGPDMVFIDSLADFLALCGLNENDAGDVTRWFAEVVKPLRDRGVAVVLLDHEPWDSRGHARGSTAKFAKVDVEWELRKTRPFDQNQEGEITLRLKKDRLAQLEHRKVTFEVGGPNLKFELSEGFQMDESVTLATESVRNTTDAIKGFGETGATDTEWKAATRELGTGSTKYYETKKAMLANGRVEKRQNSRFVYSAISKYVPPNITPPPEAEFGEAGSENGLGNGDCVTSPTPHGVKRSPSDIHSTYSGGSSTRSRWSNQEERVEGEDPDDVGRVNEEIVTEVF